MTIEELKVIISAKTEKLQDGLNKAKERLKDFQKTSDDASSKMNENTEKIKQQIDSLVRKLDNVNAQAELQQMKLKKLREAYERASNASGTDSPRALRLQEQILRTEERLRKLIKTSDKTASEINNLEESLNNAGKKAEGTGKKFNESGEKVRSLGDKARRAAKSIFHLIGIKKLFGIETRRANNAASDLSNTLNRVSRMIARNLILYGLIIKRLKGMISYTWAAFKANQQFAYSLNVIKTNLLVAFQPIYEFVFPALNALMQGIATVTTYIATSISALFGKTYKQSYNAAKGLNNTIKSMDGVGKAAGKAGKKAKKAGKEAKGALMPFDEINQLDLDKNKGADSPDTGGGDAPGFEMTMPDMATIDMSGIEKFKEIMSRIFEPFKLAWENEGQATIDSIRYALSSIGGLIKEIGKSWLEVWTNGTGQTILETILRILQNIFNTVGDIAQSFTKAWTEAELGTSIMQHIHNIILHILTLTEKLTGAFREVWGEVGTKLATAFLKNLDGILGVLDHLGEKLVWVWDHGGEHLFQGFIRLGAKILELSYFIGTEFVYPFVNWFIDLMAPAVAKLCDWIGKLFDTFSKFIDWLMGDGYPVLSVIVTVLGSMAIAFGVVKGAVKAHHAAQILANGAVDKFGKVMDWIKTPTGIAVLAIGAAISVAILLYKHWDKISEFLKSIWEGIKNTAVNIWSSITKFFKKTGENISTDIDTSWNNIKEFLETLWNGIKTIAEAIWNSIAEFLVTLWNKLLEIVKNIWNGIKTFIDAIWDTIKEITETVWNGIKSFLENIWNGIKSVAITLWNGIKIVVINPMEAVYQKLTTIWTNIKEFILKKWDEIKQGILDKKDALISAIMKPFKIADKQIHGVIGNAKSWGRNLIQNFIDGIKAMIDKVKDAVKSVADTVADHLGFHSPAKKGPGSDADKWMPNLMNMMAEGIEDNVYKIEGSVDMTARALQGVESPDNLIANAVGNAVLGAMQVSNNEPNQEQGDIILQIDGVTVGRILGPIMDREKERIGEPVIQSI